MQQGTPCDDIQNIIGDFGFVQGSLGPAPSVPVLRQLSTILEKAVLDLNDLYAAIPACQASSRMKVRNLESEV
jgi:hypothetical protein